jgi:hypothetical protein
MIKQGLSVDVTFKLLLTGALIPLNRTVGAEISATWQQWQIIDC